MSIRPRRSNTIVVAVIACGSLAVIAFAPWRDTGTQFSYAMARVERGDIASSIIVTGSLRPVGQVNVGTQLSGQISELLADHNDTVRQSQVLARLDPAMYLAQVRSAKAGIQIAESDIKLRQAAYQKAQYDLQSAEQRLPALEARTAMARAHNDEAIKDLERKQALVRRKTLSVSALDAAQAQQDSTGANLQAENNERLAHQFLIESMKAALLMSEAELSRARAFLEDSYATLDKANVELARSVILAPIDGVVIGRDVELGQTVASTLEAPTLFTLARDLRRMEVQAIVDEADIGRIREGQSASFTVDAYPARSFQAAIIEIQKAPATTENVVTYTVLLAAANPDLLLFPGMTAEVKIAVHAVNDVLTVPNRALRFQPLGIPHPLPGTPNSGFLWTVKGSGEPMVLEVHTGLSDGQHTEILPGVLEEGQEIIAGAAVPDT